MTTTDVFSIEEVLKIIKDVKLTPPQKLFISNLHKGWRLREKYLNRMSTTIVWVDSYGNEQYAGKAYTISKCLYNYMSKLTGECYPKITGLYIK